MSESFAKQAAWRIALGVSLALSCHGIDWTFFCAYTNDVLLALAPIFGLAAKRASATMLELDGARFEHVLGCTLLPYFFGFAPALWDLTATTRKNVAHIAVFFAAIFVFNILRLELGLVAFRAGVPWWLAHEVVAGVAHFLIAVVAVELRFWQHRPASDSVTPKSERVASAAR